MQVPIKPDLFATTYVRAEARTLQKTEFFRKLFSPGESVHLDALSAVKSPRWR